MNFAKLYTENKHAVESFLRRHWISKPCDRSQQTYKQRMEAIIRGIFAPEEAEPLVQCMNLYESVDPDLKQEAMDLVGGLWQKVTPKDKHGEPKYPPYRHQYLSWKTLLTEETRDGLPMSICVTTGTGSGKTECFMMPLVHDLLQQLGQTKTLMENQTDEPMEREHSVKAIFLYPLNALMEDQKERLEKLLAGTDLTYAVYNGELPDKEPDPLDTSEEAERQRRKIDSIAGFTRFKNAAGEYEYERDAEGNPTRRFPHALYTRRQVRQTPPDILLTNATMLEYILLRKSDSPLTDPTKQSLRWISIDETHSYSGAGAAELAMLLRRVIMAYGVDVHRIRFATSSATFSNPSLQREPGESEEQFRVRYEAEIRKAESELKRFIAGITGVGLGQVAVIGGRRRGQEQLEQDHQDYVRWEKLCHDDFVKLSDLFPEGTVAEKLSQLDAMCQRAGQIPGTPMKLKVHYFYRVPNNGLYVRLTRHSDGAFHIETERKDTKDPDEAPQLELGRCPHCGEYLAVGLYDEQEEVYGPLMPDDSDMFDLEEEQQKNGNKKLRIFALTDTAVVAGDGNVTYRVAGNRLRTWTGEPLAEGEWRVVGNKDYRCPHCRSKLLSGTTDSDSDDDTPIEDSHIRKFRVKADTVSRCLAPSILDQIRKYEPESGEEEVLFHDGQQYLSFVDSRAAAADASLSANLEQERLWFFSIVYKALRQKALINIDNSAEIEKWKHRIAQEDDEELLAVYKRKLKKAEEGARDYLTMEDIYRLVRQDPRFDEFCYTFAKRDRASDEIDINAEVKPLTRAKYLCTLLLENLAYRKARPITGENLGLFHVCYPGLESVTLPQAVKDFNAAMREDQNRISEKDWRDMLALFMDLRVRMNQSLYIKMVDPDRPLDANGQPNYLPVDINSAVRFASEHASRRPVKPFASGRHNNRFAKMLLALVTRDKGSVSKSDKALVDDVLQAMYDQLQDVKLIRRGEQFYPDDKNPYSGEWQLDKPKEGDPEPLRLNVADLRIKLFDQAWLCDVAPHYGNAKTPPLYRPFGVIFKGMSPYFGTGTVWVDEKHHEQWEPAPLSFGSVNKLNVWATDNRHLLWQEENNLWGEEGEFATILHDIHMEPRLYIQGEHTAQVDKQVARELQEKFKQHKINVLACSTTMEMGVNLGDLEAVMMASVPPLPANYKQRAGRSGRNDLIRSVCITLCGSDLVGLRTLYNPMEKIINRPVAVPTVDLQSLQVVRRHVNAFLVRYFDVFNNAQYNGVNPKIFHYFTPFLRDIEGKLNDGSGKEVIPSDGLGEEEGTPYSIFNYRCLNDRSAELSEALGTLLAGTCLAGDVPKVLRLAHEDNVRCYNKLQEEAELLSVPFLELVDKKNKGEKTNPRFEKLLLRRYRELMRKQLLEFWATNRFTPNANMPVNVVELDISDMKDTYRFRDGYGNPSYNIQQALGRYVPGNTVTVDGVVFRVRGVRQINKYGKGQTFETIYWKKNDGQVVKNDPSGTNNIWPVNNQEGLRLLRPTGFIPAPDESNSRTVGQNQFTRVSAQLVGAEPWPDEIPTEPHLYSLRGSTENGEILYYNEGIGYGYCYCGICGRTVMEEAVATEDNLPREMNPLTAPAREPDEPDIHYHRAISGSNVGRRCIGSRETTEEGKRNIYRNLIIGDLIQTDYCEIRLRQSGQTHWINLQDINTYDKLLHTLGIVFCQALVDVLGKERGSVDFAIMPNAHLCIFDTNPGGSGYSNRLTDPHIMAEVISACAVMLREAKEKDSKDMILDRNTSRYLEHIDIDEALDWVEHEMENCMGFRERGDLFNGALVSSTNIHRLEEAFRSGSGEMYLFVSDDLENWNYRHSSGWWEWYGNTFASRGASTNFCLTCNKGSRLEEKTKKTCREIRSWTRGIFKFENLTADNGIYPLAYIDGCLYYTKEYECATLNSLWGTGEIFCVRTGNPADGASPLDCEYLPTKISFILDPDDVKTTNSSRIAPTVHNHPQAKALIDDFVDYCRICEDPVVEVNYADKFILRGMDIVSVIQYIDYFLNLLDKKEVYMHFKLLKSSGKLEQTNAKSVLSKLAPQARNLRLEEKVNIWQEHMRKDKQSDVKFTWEEFEKNREFGVHWRALRITCGERTLSIRPNGGITQGWDFIKEGSKFFSIDEATHKTMLPLVLREPIIYDIELLNTPYNG